MALKRNERYPGRFGNPTTQHPQGAFKNRSAPGAQDGSYLESDWANDWSGFFEKLLTVGAITPNGEVDTALASQYYDALVKLTLQRSNPFADIKSDGAAAVSEALSNLGLTEIALAGVSTGNLQANGYAEFPLIIGGLRRKIIFQFMSGPGLAAGASQVVNYPIPFPNSMLGIACTPGATVSGGGTYGIQSINASSIRIWNQSTTQAAQAGSIITVGW